MTSLKDAGTPVASRARQSLSFLLTLPSTASHVPIIQHLLTKFLCLARYSSLATRTHSILSLSGRCSSAHSRENSLPVFLRGVCVCAFSTDVSRCLRQCF